MGVQLDRIAAALFAGRDRRNVMTRLLIAPGLLAGAWLIASTLFLIEPGASAL